MKLYRGTIRANDCHMAILDAASILNQPHFSISLLSARGYKKSLRESDERLSLKNQDREDILQTNYILTFKAREAI